MTYAREIFGIKETQKDIWMQDLMLAGTASTTFNSDRMREIASSPFVKDNGFAGYYLLLWCKYNAVPMNEIFRVGQKVAVQNTDYGTVDNYILVNINETMAHFASANFVAYLPALTSGATHYDGNPNNTLIGAWLKAETPNWHTGVTSSANGLGSVVAEYGYMHGVSDELKDILNQNTSQSKYFYPVINDTPYFLWNDWYPLGVRNTFGHTAIYMAKLVRNGSLDAKHALGRVYWSNVLPAGSTESNPYPLLGPSWLEKPSNIGTIEQVNALSYYDFESATTVQLTTASFPGLTGNTPHLARFTVEI